MCNLVFIVGSARSGTTILGELLDCHPDIMQWYEPYYLWRKYFLCKDSEVWKPEEYSEKVKQIIQEEHKIFQNKSGKQVVVEKMPSHSFNIEYILNIFPEAKFIHIIRDGRDITLSIKKEWRKREEIVKHKDYRRAFRTAYNVIKRAPFLRYKIMLAMYEFNSNFSLKPSKYLNKAKWKGGAGWGARFDGWEKAIEELTPLQFNAKQWMESVKAVQKNWPLINNSNRLEIRYEDLMRNPRDVLASIFSFLGQNCDDKYFQKMPILKTKNFDKWRTEFTTQEIEEIKPILSPLLGELGYIQYLSW